MGTIKMTVEAATKSGAIVHIHEIDRTLGYIHGTMNGEEATRGLDDGELLTGETLSTHGYDLDMTSFDQELLS